MHTGDDTAARVLARRSSILDEMDVIPGAEASATAAETFRRLHWDTALSWSDPVLRMIRDVVGIDRVLFGSDYPYLRRDLTLCCRQYIQANPELTNHEREAIVGGTATTLIPRLATLRPTTSTHRYAIGPDNKPMTTSLNGCSQDKHDSRHEWPPDVTHGGLGHHGEGR